MHWSDKIVLVKFKHEPDRDGYRKATEVSRREVFSDVLSTARSEFYAAMQVGVSIAQVFKIRAVDYDNERIVEYKHPGASEVTVYEIKRGYTSGSEFYILNCSLLSTPGSVGRKRAT